MRGEGAKDDAVSTEQQDHASDRVLEAPKGMAR
jgi:hypothetical protein